MQPHCSRGFGRLLVSLSDEELGRRPVRYIRVAGLVLSDVGEYLRKTTLPNVARPVHRPAGFTREAIAVKVDDVEVALPLRDALFDNFEAFVDEREKGSV